MGAVDLEAPSASVNKERARRAHHASVFQVGGAERAAQSSKQRVACVSRGVDAARPASTHTEK